MAKEEGGTKKGLPYGLTYYVIKDGDHKEHLVVATSSFHAVHMFTHTNPNITLRGVTWHGKKKPVLNKKEK